MAPSVPSSTIAAAVFVLLTIITLGIALVVWLIYRLAWAILEAKPPPKIRASRLGYPLTPGDVWAGHALCTDWHWVRLVPEDREPSWIEAYERVLVETERARRSQQEASAMRAAAAAARYREAQARLKDGGDWR